MFDLPRSSILNKDLLLHINPYKTLKNVHTKLETSNQLTMLKFQESAKNLPRNLVNIHRVSLTNTLKNLLEEKMIVELDESQPWEKNHCLV